MRVGGVLISKRLGRVLGIRRGPVLRRRGRGVLRLIRSRLSGRTAIGLQRGCSNGLSAAGGMGAGTLPTSGRPPSREVPVQGICLRSDSGRLSRVLRRLTFVSAGLA